MITVKLNPGDAAKAIASYEKTVKQLRAELVARNLSLAEIREVWHSIWELCRELGMEMDQETGQQDVLNFIRTRCARTKKQR